jgi:hypothetical protein
MQIWRLFFVLLLVLVLTSSAYARQQTRGIEGEWYIIDHKKHRPSVLLKIKRAVQKDTYEATFEKIFDSDTGESIKLCTGCSKTYEKVRVKGMLFMKDLVKRRHWYKKGKILDPRNGHWYNVMCKLKNHGAYLKVRAYLLFPMLGKTELFVRKTG